MRVAPVGDAGVRPLALVGLSVLAGLTALASTHPLHAQAPDIEAVAALRGIPLPTGHAELLSRQPDLYTFERALFRRGAPARTATTGSVELPVILILFSDSPEVPLVSREEVRDALFGYGTSPRGTITEAYEEMSLGALTVTGQVYGWVRSDLPMESVVGSSFSLGSDNRVGEYFVDGLEQLDSVIDFTRYDNDGPDGLPDSGDDDGYVDVVTFEFLEVSASCGGPAIWPHRSRMSSRIGAPWETDDIGVGGAPILVQDYITQGAMDCAGTNVQDAAVITHEFGHALGLPDWYHWVDPSLGPAGRRWVMGCWALMAAGSWGCGPVPETREPFGPSHMLGFTKDWLGWFDLVDPGEVWNEEIRLPPIRTSGVGLRIPLDDGGTDYLIAEFRELDGFDHALPAAGVLLYQERADLSIWTKPAADSDDPYPLTMLERDDDRSLLRIASEGGSRGEAGDAWGVDGAGGKLNGATSPALRAGGAWTHVQVHDVRIEGGEAVLVLSTGRTPRLIERPQPVDVMRVRTFREGVRIAGGVGPYTGVGELPEGLSFEALGDELLLTGSLLDDAPRTVAFAVRDAAGATSNQVALTVRATQPWFPEVETLVDRLLSPRSERLTPGEQAWLDREGNDNGRYDVGDLRRWLLENR